MNIYLERVTLCNTQSLCPCVMFKKDEFHYPTVNNQCQNQDSQQSVSPNRLNIINNLNSVPTSSGTIVFNV